MQDLLICRTIAYAKNYCKVSIIHNYLGVLNYKSKYWANQNKSNQYKNYPEASTDRFSDAFLAMKRLLPSVLFELENAIVVQNYWRHCMFKVNS